MTYKFKKGDKVVCTKPESTVEKDFDVPAGTVFTVAEGGDFTIKVEGQKYGLYANRFRLAGVGEIATFEALTALGANDDPARGTPATRFAPDTNPKTRFGLAKPPLGLIPGTARVLLSQAFADGVAKYGPANWRESPVSASTYVNAAERHLTSWYDGEETASDSGVHHLAHAAACLLILLDAQANGTMNDDRPPPGKTGELIKQLTKPTT